MSNLSHFTVTTGDLRTSPRSEIDDRTMEMLTPVVRAGFGIVGGLSIVLETHHVDNDAEAWVFTLGFKSDVPAVRCWLSRTSKSGSMGVRSERATGALARGSIAGRGGKPHARPSVHASRF
jgi:hypothetical protein